jgi:hypothetical protein
VAAHSFIFQMNKSIQPALSYTLRQEGKKQNTVDVLHLPFLQFQLPQLQLPLVKFGPKILNGKYTSHKFLIILL